MVYLGQDKMSALMTTKKRDPDITGRVGCCCEYPDGFHYVRQKNKDRA